MNNSVSILQIIFVTLIGPEINTSFQANYHHFPVDLLNIQIISYLPLYQH
jgi:hypothetical protein